MKAVADILTDLVAIPSVSGTEAQIADYAAAALTGAGCEVERLENTVLAQLARGRGPRLLLNSHLDTVPVGQGWTHAPFAAQWDGDRLYGRGANDAKASASAMIWAMAQLAQSPDWSGEIWLALTACEETTNAGMAAVVQRLGLPHGAITGEPTGLEVVRAQSGLAVLAAEWSGRSCHAAHVGRVEHSNALHTAARQIVATAPYMKVGSPHALLGDSTLVATVFRAGERHNVVPDRAEALFDARLAPPQRAVDAARLLSSVLADARISVRSERLRSIETAEDHPLVQAALRAAGRERAIGSSTLSDMALLQGVPCVKCGPGETARSHTPDEFVLRAEVEAGAQLYVRFAPLALEALGALAPGVVTA